MTGKETQFVIIVDATTRSIVKLYVKNLELFTAAEEFELKMVYTYLQIGDNIDSNEIAVTVKITEPECIPVNYRFDPVPSDLTFDQLLSEPVLKAALGNPGYIFINPENNNDTRACLGNLPPLVWHIEKAASETTDL